jgi:hypothetical protein
MTLLISSLGVMTGEEQDFLDIGLEDLNWIRLARDRDQWPDVVKAIMKHRGIS